MNKPKSLALLMMATILVIAGFQVFWLKENYDREMNSLNIKSGIVFREAVYGLQESGLKLNKFGHDSSLEFTVKLDEPMKDSPMYEEKRGQNVIKMVNILKNKIRDSAHPDHPPTKEVMINVDNNATVFYKSDSISNHPESFPGQPGNKIVRFLYGIDSLQDSLKVKDIKKVTDSAFKTQKLEVPIEVRRLNTISPEMTPPETREVTIGFAHPVTYKVDLGNTLPYILKRLASPILFSVFLIGFTILSFVLLYRSLLQQKRLTELKNDFISNITHELKTPIATVNVAIEALRSFNALNNPERTKEYLDISHNELQRLSLLVDKVLKLSMFENKEVDLKYENIQMDSLIQEVVSTMRLQFEKNGAAVSVEKTGSDFSLQADRLHMTSVIYNLLDNALKYSKSNPAIRIHIKDEGNKLWLVFEDNGIGIPSEYKNKVFEKFFRVPHGDHHNVKGYGLGLSYVSYIIKKHKGDISVQSEKDEGSSFIITIPRSNA